MNSNVSFLIFYVVKFIGMVGVVALAIFLGVTLRKLYDKKKSAKKASTEVTEDAALPEGK